MDSRLRSNYLIVGHSHIVALQRAAENADCANHTFSFIQMHKFKELDETARQKSFLEKFKQLEAAADFIVLCTEGNQHNILGLFAGRASPKIAKAVRKKILDRLKSWIRLVKPYTAKPIALLPAPPPIGSEQHLRAFPGVFKEKMDELPIRAPAERLSIWQAQCQALDRASVKNNLSVIQLPDGVFAADGLLAEDCYGKDPTHGNATYGQRVLLAIADHFEGSVQESLPEVPHARQHFYTDLPDYAYWRRSISNVPQADVDPVASAKFVVRSTDKVAAAGSCFAQHILKRLRAQGFDCCVTEPAPPVAEGQEPPAEFSARFGNIYTSRQLVQLFDRAFGDFQPSDRAWLRQDGRYCDPFRPTVERDGFASGSDVVQAAAQHLEAVRRMFRELDVFVFTLGLTECWQSRLDKAAYPIAPGVAGGQYDPAPHELVNLGVRDVAADLQALITKLGRVNPQAKVILTVSPVPLVATAIDRHVLVSTTYSKSVLRVAAGEVADAYDFVEYFPSYEIITGAHAQGGYFGPDRRSVTERGVDHVMKVFFARMTDMETAADADESPGLDQHVAEMEALAEAQCDQELLSGD